MLRASLIAISGAVFLGGLVGLGTGRPAGMPAAVWGGLVFAALLFERWRYKQSPPRPDAHWIRTDEAFVDPESGRTLQVWYDPRTGERRYLAADDEAGRG